MRKTTWVEKEKQREVNKHRDGEREKILRQRGRQRKTDLERIRERGRQ